MKDSNNITVKQVQESIENQKLYIDFLRTNILRMQSFFVSFLFLFVILILIPDFQYKIYVLLFHSVFTIKMFFNIKKLNNKLSFEENVILRLFKDIQKSMYDSSFIPSYISFLK